MIRTTHNDFQGWNIRWHSLKPSQSPASPLRIIVRQGDEAAPASHQASGLGYVAPWPEWWPHADDAKGMVFGRCMLSAQHVQFTGWKGKGFLVFATPQTSYQGDADQELDLAPAPFATWSTTAQELTCFAHPTGRGTFYYVRRDGRLLLSTSLRDLCRAARAWTPEEETVAEFLAMGTVLGLDMSRTFVAGVRQIPPGCRLVWSKDNISVGRYWNPQRDAIVNQYSFSQAAAHVRRAIDAAVASATRDEPNVGCLFSGGIDSCAVAATAIEQQRTRETRVELFNVGTDLGTAEERWLRREFLRYFQYDTHTVDLDPSINIFASLREMNRLSDYPVGCTFSGVFEAIARKASALDCSILLSGDGGDEVFGVAPYLLPDLILARRWSVLYEALAYSTALDSSRAVSSEVLKDAFDTVLAVHSPRLRSILRAAPTGLRRLTAVHGHEEQPERLLLGSFVEKTAGLRDRIFENLRCRLEEGWALSDYWHYRQTLQVPAYEPNFDYLAYRDRGTRLRTASPLSDPAVLRAAMSLRLEDRISTAVGFRAKRLLRLAVSDRLPHAVAHHRKIGSSDHTLLRRMLMHQGEEVAALLTADSLASLGIVPDPGLLDTPNLLCLGHLDWLRVCILGIWLDELRESVEAAG